MPVPVLDVEILGFNPSALGLFNGEMVDWDNTSHGRSNEDLYQAPPGSPLLARSERNWCRGQYIPALSASCVFYTEHASVWCEKCLRGIGALGDDPVCGR